jgi:putative protein kinase ArgK-like GTPase of G3E family
MGNIQTAPTKAADKRTAWLNRFNSLRIKLADLLLLATVLHVPKSDEFTAEDKENAEDLARQLNELAGVDLYTKKEAEKLAEKQVKELQADHVKSLKDLNDSHAKSVEKLQKEHEKQLEKATQAHAKEVEKLQKEIDKLSA